MSQDRMEDNASPQPPLVLTEVQARVIGSMIEKQRTVPEQYPMTLNYLLGACNQKSSRDPVVEYGDEVVLAALDELSRMSLIQTVASAGARVPKYGHLLDRKFPLSLQELCVLAALMLRKAQTSAEIRRSTERMWGWQSLEEVDTALETLARGERPFVVKLNRAPGARESRWMHTFYGIPSAEAADSAPQATAIPSSHSALLERMDMLEARVRYLESLLDVDGDSGKGEQQ